MRLTDDLLSGLAKPLRGALLGVCTAVRSAGGRALVAGGAVRDALLGQPHRDLDVEVFGLDLAALERAVAPVVPVLRAGAAFEVLLVRGLPLELVLPRQPDGAWGAPRDPRGRYAEAVATAADRRDFTLDAIYLDPLTGELLDPRGGQADLEAHLLRHTSRRFAEDPLRVLRGMQLVARFELIAVPETVALCRTLTPSGLAAERLFEEWRKLLLKGVAITRGLGFVRDTGWLRHFPELAALDGCPQESEHHPEGDVWTHTGHCLDFFAAERQGDEREDLVVGLAVLCHDLGKPATTALHGGAWISPGHEAAGEAPTRAFLARMTRETDLIDEIVPLVREHVHAVQVARELSDTALLRLAHRAGRLDRLVRVARADLAGRPPRVFDGFPEGEHLLARARELAVERSAPVPLLFGRHLLELGVPPGPEMGRLLAALFERQLDGEFATVEQGVALARALVGTGATGSAAAGSGAEEG